MAFTLLIVAARETPDGAPVALLPVAGRTLIEHQALRAQAAGAAEVLLVAPSLPDGLVAALDRLRRDGLPVRVALNAADAVGKAPAAMPLLLLADGVLPDIASFAALPANGALLVLPDAPDRAAWERIDGDTRWAGLARFGVAQLAETALMLGEWDLELTLVRRLVADADRVEANPAAVVRVEDPAGARAATDRAIGGGHVVTQMALATALDRRVEARWLRYGGVALSVGGAGLLGFGPLWLGLPALLLAGPVGRLGARLAAVRAEPDRHRPGFARARLAAMAAALILYGWRLSGAPGYEPLLLAAVALAFFVAARNERRLTALPPDIWSARPEWMAWATAPLALFGYGRWALAGLALWTGASFFRLQWRALRGEDEDAA
jgi:hypothetical protein